MKTKLKQIGAGIVASLAAALSFAPATLAWGPERDTYEMNRPADSAVFNSITDNAFIGDERQFVKIVEEGVGKSYSDDLTIEAGKVYRVFIYYHNDASETYNDEAHGNVGIAREVKVASSFPDALKKNERDKVYGVISSVNTKVKDVWDEAYVTAKEDMTLHYVNGSARVNNAWLKPTTESNAPKDENGKSNVADLQLGLQGAELEKMYILQDNHTLADAWGGLKGSSVLFSDNNVRDFFNKGQYIGTMYTWDGAVPGCDKFSGSVTYLIKTVAADMPSEMPETGPVQIAVAVVIVAAGVFVWVKVRANLHKATRQAKGRK